MSKDKKLKNVHAIPAYVAENNFGDYVTVAARILRNIYQYIVNENQSEISNGILTFEITENQTWLEILRLPSDRRSLASIIINHSGVRALILDSRPANIHHELASEAIDELINLFNLSREELNQLAARTSSQGDIGNDLMQILNSAIVPIALGLHEFFDALLGFRFEGFNISAPEEELEIGSARVALSINPKDVIKRTKRFGLRFHFAQIYFPNILLVDRGWNVAPVPIEKLRLKVLTDISQPVATRSSRPFDHSVLRGRALKLALELNPREALAMPYDFSEVPRYAKRQVEEDVAEAVANVIDPFLNDGLEALATVLENILPEKLVQYFGAQTYDVTRLKKRTGNNIHAESGNPKAIYPEIKTSWKAGKLRLESLVPHPGGEGQFDRGPIEGFTPDAQLLRPPPRPYDTIESAQEDVFDMWNATTPDWPEFPFDRKFPGRVRLASNAVGPTIFARHIIRDADIIKRLKVGDDFMVNIRDLADIALDFQGRITPVKQFADKPALLVRGLRCEFNLDGKVSDVSIDARIRLRPVLLSHGSVKNMSPTLRRELAERYSEKSSLTELVEDVHFRNFVFLHQSYLPSEIEIFLSSNIPDAVPKSDVRKFCEKWARAIPAIPLMLDPWFSVHPSSVALKTSRQSRSQGEVLPLIKMPDPLGFHSAAKQLALSEGVLNLFGEWIIDTQPLDSTQNIVSTFKNVSVRNGWLVMDRNQSILDAF
ncbi:hypothetical protein [Hellea balneolensis]|uniref:hypothetical protein n=1 Tax=Hellea balneolensis TaxID=287478 RepID=UPI00040884FD|nr:hypothetical protein [Hellea balneolensis]